MKSDRSQLICLLTFQFFIKIVIEHTLQCQFYAQIGLECGGNNTDDSAL